MIQYRGQTFKTYKTLYGYLNPPYSYQSMLRRISRAKCRGESIEIALDAPVISNKEAARKSIQVQRERRTGWGRYG